MMINQHHSFCGKVTPEHGVTLPVTSRAYPQHQRPTPCKQVQQQQSLYDNVTATIYCPHLARSDSETVFPPADNANIR